MVTRQAATNNESTDSSGDRTVNQCITLSQAMAAFTREAAKADETGTIEPGKSADFIPHRNISASYIREVHNTQITRRWVYGISQ